MSLLSVLVSSSLRVSFLHSLHLSLNRYWRMIADLNPSIPCDKDTAEFESSLRDVFQRAVLFRRSLTGNYIRYIYVIVYDDIL